MLLCSTDKEFIQKYENLLLSVRLILSDKSLILEDYENIFKKRRGLTFEDISNKLKKMGIKFEKMELVYVLNYLISNSQQIVRDDFWTGETRYTLLEKNVFKSGYQRNYYKFTDDNKGPKIFLLRADEHIGSDIFNPKLSHNLSDYAIKNGATICFHIGDLFEGLSELSDEQYKYGASEHIISENEEEFWRQIELFKFEYPHPYPNELRTYCLMGNHDETMNRFLKYQSRPVIRGCDLRKISIYDPSFCMFPGTEWTTNLNGIDFHFNHRLYMSGIIPDLKISELSDIDKNEDMLGDLILDYKYNVYVSGHMHEPFSFANPSRNRQKQNLYLSTPSTSNINIGGIVGYLVYMYPESNVIEVAILGCDNNLNIYEADRITWDFSKQNKTYRRVFRTNT